MTSTAAAYFSPHTLAVGARARGCFSCEDFNGNSYADQLVCRTAGKAEGDRATEFEFLYTVLFREESARSAGDDQACAAAAAIRRSFLDRHLGRWITMRQQVKAFDGVFSTSSPGGADRLLALETSHAMKR